MNIEESISKLKRQITAGKCEKNIGIQVFISDLETLLTAYEKEKEENEQWKKYATNDLENQITERNNKILKLEAELEKEKDKNKELQDRVDYLSRISGLLSTDTIIEEE